MKKLLPILLIITYSQTFAQAMTSVATGEYSHHYLKSDGTIWYTQLITFNSVYAQQQITSLDSIVDLDGGQYTSIFLRKNGKVFSATGNSNNSTAYPLDNLGNAFTADKVYAMWRMCVAIKSGKVYYWSANQANPEDMLYQFSSTLTNSIPAPRLLVQPAGETIVKCVFGAGLSPYGNAFLWGLASDGTLWQWDATHTTPFQVVGKTSYTNRWTGIVTDVVANFDARMVITSTNQVWTWGYNSGNYGGHFDYQNVDMDNIAGNLTTAGIQFPIKQTVASYLTIQLIDATNSRYGIGTNQTGNLGSGYMWPSFRTNKAGSTPTPWAYNYQPYDGLQATWLKMPGQWLQLRDNSSFVFYTYGQDMGGNWYAWGRGKDQSTLSGYTSQAADQSSYPDWMTIPAPRLVYPFTQTWVVDGAVDTTAARKPWASAGISQYASVGTTSFTLSGAASHQNQPTAAGVTITTTNNWTRTSGPNVPSFTAASISPVVTGAIPGTYVFRNTVTNSNAATDFQETTISIPVSTGKWYVNAQGSDAADGTTPATAWQTITKVNTATLAAGDSLLFNRGDVFYGTLRINYSGTVSQPIVVSSYGTGAKARISGMTTLSSWTLLSGSIYYATNSSIDYRVNMLTLNGLPQQLGRYPNQNQFDGGYLNYNARTQTVPAKILTIDTAIITTASVSGLTLTGAEVWKKTQGYTGDLDSVTYQLGSTIRMVGHRPSINLSGDGAGIKPATAPAADDFGLFFQRALWTLDQQGEWYYDGSTNRMYVHFGALTPSAQNVKVSTVDTLINIGSHNYINVDNIDIDGANKFGIYVNNAIGVNVRFDKITNSGSRGIFAWNSGKSIINADTILNTMSTAIDWQARTQSGMTVTNNVINNTGYFAGMQHFNSNADDQGIYCATADTSTGYNNILYNKVVNTGYSGIHFQGENTIVAYNYVDTACYVKDDGGLIYTFHDTLSRNRVVMYNTAVNSLGAPYGNQRPVHAEGIYLDGETAGVFVHDNTLANISNAGLYTNDPKFVTFRHNTSYNAGRPFCVNKHSNANIYNFSFVDNIMVSGAKPEGNTQVYSNSGVIDNSVVTYPTVTNIQDAMKQYGFQDSNFYSFPTDDYFQWYYYNTATSGNSNGSAVFVNSNPFATWASYTLHDLASTVIPTTTTTALFNNYTASSSTQSFAGQKKDVYGTTYNGTVTIAPYTSIMLLTTLTPALNITFTGGSSQSIQLPATTLNVTGNSTGTAPINYTWSFLSGPVTPTISAPNAATTNLTGLTTAGAYTFNLSASDNVGSTGNSVLTITVLNVAGVGSVINLRWVKYF